MFASGMSDERVRELYEDMRDERALAQWRQVRASDSGWFASADEHAAEYLAFGMAMVGLWKVLVARGVESE